MRHILRASIFALFSFITAQSQAQSVTQSFEVLFSGGNGGGGGTGGVAFTPLHTYYMSPNGSDSNSGADPSHPWASPNHNLVCGDVIIAAPGAYRAGGFGSFGSVSSCPSTSGGIDGTGGIYFAVLLCGGTDLGTTNGCFGNAGNAVEHYFDVAQSHWAIEGWTITGGGANARAFETHACGGVVAYNAYINDVAYNAAEAYDGDDCGQSGGHNTIGADYQAVIGMIAQNAAQDAICLAAIDVVGPGVLDTNAGTHQFIYNNYSYANANPGCRSISDTEDYMADTWDAHNADYQGVWDNNIGFNADRFCIQLFTSGSEAATYKLYNNTCFNDNLNTGPDTGADGEFNLNDAGSGAIGWATTIINNIAYTTKATASGFGGAVPVAMAIYQTATNLTNGGSGSQNIFRANQPGCGFAFCDSTESVWSNGTSANLGTNTYVSPGFKNTTDLLNNRLGAPNCAGFQTTTECMGYNPNTQTLTNPSIIYDLQPTTVGMAGKGYQLPSTTCTANSDYPTWLKGIVYLHWNGSTITENPDLVTKPCGL